MRVQRERAEAGANFCTDRSPDSEDIEPTSLKKEKAKLSEHGRNSRQRFCLEAATPLKTKRGTAVKRE